MPQKRAVFARLIPVTLGDTASLIIALSDLKAVEAVTKAINANLPKTGPLGTIPQGFGPGTFPVLINRSHDNPEIGPRLKANISSDYLPRQVIHTVPERKPDSYVPRSPASCDPAPACKHASPILPPWKKLPPITHETVIIRPKVFVQKVDLITKGTLIDLFL